MIIQTFICDGCTKKIEPNDVVKYDVMALHSSWDGDIDFRGHLCPECGRKLVKAIKEKTVFAFEFN